MEKAFKEYLSESDIDYLYTLKLAVNDVTPGMIDNLEMALSKYQLKSASSFKKTPIQQSPLDFPNVKNCPVFISEIVMAYPGSIDFMRFLIANALHISEQSVAVYTENDPRKYTTDFFLEVISPEYKENYIPRIGSEPCATGDPKLGGQQQADSLLKELSELSKERDCCDVYHSPLSVDVATDDVLPADYDDFNDGADSGPSLFGRPPALPRMLER